MKRWLPVILLLLVLIGCKDIDFDTSFLFGCEDGSVSPASDPQYLCVMWEDNDDFESFAPYFVKSGSMWDMFTFTDGEPGDNVSSAVRRALYDVDKDLGEGLRHGEMAAPLGLWR